MVHYEIVLWLLEKCNRKWWSPYSFLRSLGGCNDTYSTREVSLWSLVIVAHEAVVKKDRGGRRQTQMEGGGLGEREDTCYENPLVFISGFVGERKIPIG